METVPQRLKPHCKCSGYGTAEAVPLSKAEYFNKLLKRVTLSSSDKGLKTDFCKGSDKLPTAVLWGMDDITKDAINRAKSKQQNH